MIDITGTTFHYLVALEFSHYHKSRDYWRFYCTRCGSICIRSRNAIISTSRKSCGCLRNPANAGQGNTREYRIWHNMMGRCYDVRHASYKWYGAKGIHVSERWHEFTHFRNDMGAIPAPMTLDRIDNTRGYCKDNCRLSDYVTQNNNRTNNHHLTLNGETHTLAEWCAITGLKHCTLRRRLERGWNAEEALNYSLNTVARPSITLTHDGHTFTVRQWADKIGLAPATIYRRLSRGWSVSDIVNTPNRLDTTGG